MSIKYLAITALLALLAAQSALACGPATATVSLVGNNKGGDIYDAAAVATHVNNQLGSVAYLSNSKTTLSCVDARSDDPILGTPGGDLAEFLGAVVVYYRTINQAPTVASVRALFRQFMASATISKDRPFYFHTDDSRLRTAFAAISTRLGRNITILPTAAPPAAELPVWLDELSKGDAQGCGHIRLMINNFTTYGLNSDFLPRTMIQIFYDEFWQASATERLKYSYVIKLGALVGRAVGVVSVTGTCATAGGYTPALRPSSQGSTIFVYAADAVKTFRRDVLTPFFVQQSTTINSNWFFGNVTEFLDAQLGATLTYLRPANEVNIYSIAVSTTGQPPVPAGGQTSGAMNMQGMGAPAMVIMVLAALTALFSF